MDRKARTHPAPPAWHLQGMRGVPWLCAGLLEQARWSGEMTLSVRSCSISKGQVAHEGLGFATLSPAKPKHGLGHHWSKDFCVQSNTFGLEMGRYLGNDVSSWSEALLSGRQSGAVQSPSQELRHIGVSVECCA